MKPYTRLVVHETAIYVASIVGLMAVGYFYHRLELIRLDKEYRNLCARAEKNDP